MKERHAGGLSVIELLAVIVLVGVALMATIPSAARFRAASLTSAAAREIVATLESLRWKAAAGGRSHGMWFRKEEGDWVWYEVRDGNGNGVRTAEIERGIDPILAGPHRPGDRLPQVRFGFPELGAIPRIPPASGEIERLDDPLRIGRADLLVFSPLGSCTSGTLYLTGGERQLHAVVLFGGTGRIRVWRFAAGSGSWSLT